MVCYISSLCLSCDFWKFPDLFESFFLVQTFFKISRQMVILRTGHASGGVPRESMSGTRHKVKQLRNGEYKVEDLRDEEEQHSLAEMSEDRNDGKWHSSKVAERVANKHSRWIPNNGQHSTWSTQYNIKHKAQTQPNSNWSSTAKCLNSITIIIVVVHMLLTLNLYQ